MDEITAPKDRAVAVAGGAGLVAAGVDEGVQTAEEVVGKDEILHINFLSEQSEEAKRTPPRAEGEWIYSRQKQSGPCGHKGA